MQLEPLALIIGTSYAGISWLARQWDQAIEQTKKTLDLAPDFVPGLWALARAYVGKGVYESAITYAQQAVERSGCTQLYFIADLGHAYARAGRQQEAIRVLNQLREISTHRYVDPCLIAQVLVALGEHEEALGSLEHALQQRAAWVTYLPIDPWFDPLRSNPRFQDLLQRALGPKTGDNKTAIGLRP